MSRVWTSVFYYVFMPHMTIGMPNDICKIDKKMKKSNCENIYIWNKARNDFISLLNVTSLRPDNRDFEAIRGETVRVIADNMLPYVESWNGSEKLGGFLGEIWGIIQDHIKFETIVSSVYYDTGLNLIESGQADVMLAAVVVKDGLRNVYYSQPYFYNWYHLFISNPEARASSLSYIKTFDPPLWFLTLGLFLFLTMSLWLTSKLLNRRHRKEKHISVPSCFLGIIAGFINQGYDLKLKSYSTRIILMFALFLGVVLYSAINAVLVSQLAVYDTHFPFESLQDIAKRGTHSLCIRTNSFVYNNFTNSNKEILPEWKYIVNGPGCLDINNQTNLAQILCKKNLIILENRVVMDRVLKNNEIPCAVLGYNEKLFSNGNSFMMLKAFKFRKMIDAFIKRMRSTGVLERIQDKWVQRDKLVQANIVESPQVTMDHISGILLMYVFMICVSFIIMYVEIVYFRYSRKRNKSILFQNVYIT